VVVLKPPAPQKRKRAALAAALAAGLHLLTLLALGWRIPKVATPEPADDRTPPLEVTLVRPQRVERAPAEASPLQPAPSPPAPAARVLVSPAPGAPALSAPEQAPPQVSAQATEPRHCAPEDLVLLTEAEKARCRNEIDADKERRRARGEDERIAKEMAEAHRWQDKFRAREDREAYYDRLTHALAKQTDANVEADKGAGVPPAPAPGVGVGGSCQHVQYPILGGVEVNPNLFRKKHMEEHPQPSPTHCDLALGAPP
jgi:hypothetical protein